MLVRDMKDGYYLRIDSGEEVIAAVTKFCEENKIKSGLISGLGSLSEVELGLYDLGNKEYLKTEFNGIYEIASMNGNISSMDGKPYLHIHAVISDAGCKAFGGHFARGIVAATCEIVIKPFTGQAGRYFSKEIGLNLLDI